MTSPKLTGFLDLRVIGGTPTAIRRREPAEFVPIAPSGITYSANGKMVGGYRYRGHHISVCDIATGVLVHSHSLDISVPFPTHIWTHGESLLLAVISETTIAIWEVGFTPGATLTEVEVPPTPDRFHIDHVEGFQFLPTPCRLAFISWDSGVLVWDFQNSRCLLECTATEFHPRMSFSSNGHFFACPAIESDIYLWKESPTGYIPHRILADTRVVFVCKSPTGINKQLCVRLFKNVLSNCNRLQLHGGGVRC